MKFLFKGVLLGFSLVIVNRLCCEAIGINNEEMLQTVGTILFFLITTAFLVSRNVFELFGTGLTGLLSMFAIQIFGLWLFTFNTIACYIGGFYGSMAAIPAGIVLTLCKNKALKEGETMAKDLKIKLMLYALVSAVSFTYLVMPEKAGISVLIFALIQLACLYFIVPERRRLVMLVPVFVMSLNCFISANTIWRVSNAIVSAILYSTMFMEFNFRADSFKWLFHGIELIISPFVHFMLPFRWILEINSEKAPVIKRIGLALIIAIPCAMLLSVVLASADMVFNEKTGELATRIFEAINFHSLLLILCGIVVGLYLFGALYASHCKKEFKEIVPLVFKGDLIIINILLITVLFVYTMFVIIQFKYLFAGSTLPYDLTFTEYARKGFFELLALTGVNIAIILAVVKLTKTYTGRWMAVTKLLCHYLCAVTIVLLVSSFYRMYLYTNDDGLTRLRFFVMGFLVFEAIGLLLTFAYIAKPKFNITLSYVAIALVYYTVLNVVPADNIIAKNQIDKYMQGEREGLEYIFTLSADAAPAMEYLYENTTDEAIKQNVRDFLSNRLDYDIPDRWQRFDLSTARAEKVRENIGR